MTGTVSVPAAAFARFPTAPRELLVGRELLRRVDTKFVASVATLVDLSIGLEPHYAILPVTSGFARYRSLYFDTPDLQCFHDHRRGRRVRHKVRIRHYDDRSLSFFEIKTKRNEHLTEKTRVELPYRQDGLGSGERGLADDRGLPGERLAPVMWIEYRRLTLLGLETSERVTIDVGLELVTLDGTRHAMEHLAIIEVKQSPFSTRTAIMRAVHAAGLRPQSMSKYVIGVASLMPDVRHNRLLPAVRQVESVV